MVKSYIVDLGYKSDKIMKPTFRQKSAGGHIPHDRQNTKWSEEIAGKRDWQPVSFRFETQMLDKDGR